MGTFSFVSYIFFFIKVPVCKQCRTSDLGLHCLPMSTLRDATVGTSGKYPPYLRCSDLFTGRFL